MDFSQLSGGIFTSELIRDLVHANHIFGAFPDTIAESSLSLTATSEVYRIPGVMVPQPGERVRSLLHKVSGLLLPTGSPLETRCSYAIRLREALVLPPEVFARFSSRNEKFALALLADGVSFFDEISPGYVGELWMLATPHEGPIFLREDEKLGSLSFFTRHTPLSWGEVFAAHHGSEIFYDREGNAMMPVPHERHCITLTLHGDAPFFLHAHSQQQGESAEQIRLPLKYAGRITHENRTFYLPPGFGNSSPAGLPISLPLSTSRDSFWQPEQPLCAIEIIPTAQEKISEPALYTPPPPESTKNR